MKRIEKMSSQLKLNNESKFSYSNEVHNQLTDDVIEETIDNCNRSIETLDAVMECLQELNSLLIKNSIWQKKYIDNNKFKKL